MIKKTVELEHEISDEVTIKVLRQNGIVSGIGIYGNDLIRYEVEYSNSGKADSRWMDSFEIESDPTAAIGFVKKEK